MPASADQIAHARDLFGALGEITSGRMFSGTALYVESDVMFACLLAGTIWMKSDESTRAQFEAAGSRAFSYQKSTRDQQVASLMSLPDSAVDDPDEAIVWARVSYAPALKAAKKKTSGQGPQSDATEAFGIRPIFFAKNLDFLCHLSDIRDVSATPWLTARDRLQ